MQNITKITDRKIRLGFAGCGRISGKHFDALADHKDNIELVAVCDPSEENARSAANRMSAKYYTSLDKMLSSEKLDIVTVATPNGLHADHITQIAEKSIHVITEKPMAIKLSDGIKIRDHCKKQGVQLFVIHQNRFNDTAQEIWKARSEGRFGKIYMITSNVFWNRNQAYYDKEGSWHGTKEMDGGAFHTQASHYLDFMEWIADSKIKTVYANLKTLARKIETEDTGIANIEWENNIIGNINVTMLTYPQNFEGSVTILGEKGTVRIGGVAMNKIEHWQFADENPRDQEIVNANYETASVYGFGHVKYYENVVNVFRGKEKPLIDADEGLKSLRLLEGIHKSNESRQIIQIKENE